MSLPFYKNLTCSCDLSRVRAALGYYLLLISSGLCRRFLNWRRNFISYGQCRLAYLTPRICSCLLSPLCPLFFRGRAPGSPSFSLVLGLNMATTPRASNTRRDMSECAVLLMTTTTSQRFFCLGLGTGSWKAGLLPVNLRLGSRLRRSQLRRTLFEKWPDRARPSYLACCNMCVAIPT